MLSIAIRTSSGSARQARKYRTLTIAYSATFRRYMATSSLHIKPVIDGVDIEDLSKMAADLSEKMNEVLDLAKRIEESAVKVELRLTPQ